MRHILCLRMNQIYHSKATGWETKRVQANRFCSANQGSEEGAIAADLVQWHVTIDYELIDSQ